MTTDHQRVWRDLRRSALAYRSDPRDSRDFSGVVAVALGLRLGRPNVIAHEAPVILTQ
jgi:hypothetical protein